MTASHNFTTFSSRTGKDIAAYSMLESAIEFLQTLSPFGVLAFVFFTTYIENLFPPSPSDVLLVFCGTLVGIGTVGFIPMFIAATLGSITGFLSMYWIGHAFGSRLIEKKKVPFLPLDAVEKVEGWFRRYGYWLIVVNRFLTGTRAVISFFAGVSKLDLTKTTLLCGVSAALWNAIMIWLGYKVGENWQVIEIWLGRYSQIVFGILILVVVVLVIRWIATSNGNKGKKEEKKNEADS